MIYIAGKITCLPTHEVDAKFQEAENKLHALGLKVINPTKLGISYSWTWEEQMAVCLKVIEERATAIYFLPDSKDSKGAKKEMKRVLKLNERRKHNQIRIYFEEYYGIEIIEIHIKKRLLTCLIPTE